MYFFIGRFLVLVGYMLTGWTDVRISGSLEGKSLRGFLGARNSKLI